MDNIKRSWMYERLDGRGAINSSFIVGVDEFIMFACSQRNRMSGNDVRCPCKKCHNIKYVDTETVKLHLFRFGFVEDYFIWRYQGEKEIINEMSTDLHGGIQPELEYNNSYRQMILDATGPNFGQASSWQSYSNVEPESSHHFQSSMEEEPNPNSQKFYDLLQAADAELYPSSLLSQLVVVSRMLNIKIENNLSQRGYNQVMQLLKEALPEDNQVLDSYYQTKKLVRSLGLPVEKIDYCNSGCMLYWGDDKKAARRYSDFISVIKKGVIRPKYVPEETWKSWMTIWKDPKSIERSKINSRNCRGSEDAIAQGTHTGGSITIGEHRKRLAIEKGRDPTPSEIHLHVHRHGHDEKSFIGERARIVHEKYQEILQNQAQSQSSIDQFQAFYQAAGGEKRRRIYGLGSQTKLFYGPNLRASSGYDASASIPSLNVQTTPIDMDEFAKKLIPSLTNNMLPILAERVRELISSPSSQSDTPCEQLSSMAPPVPVTTAPPTANIVDVHASISEDNRDSPVFH